MLGTVTPEQHPVDYRTPRVRWSEAEGFEMRCLLCGEWWPLDNADPATYWMPERGLRRCRACIRELCAASKRLSRTNPAVRARERARERDRGKKRRIERLWRRAQEREATRRYYARNADAIRAKRRTAYWAAKATVTASKEHAA